MIDTNDLINPINLNKIDIDEINFFSGIPDLFFDAQNPLTLQQPEFYNDVKFPNYDDIENFGTLLDKSSNSIFGTKRLEKETKIECLRDKHGEQYKLECQRM